MRDQIVQLLTYARGMWRYRWYGLVLTWVVSVVGWGYIYTVPDRFQANARVQISGQSALGPLLKGLAIDTDMLAKVSLMTRIIMGRKNLNNIIDNTDLKNLATTPKARRELISNLQKNIYIQKPSRRGGPAIFKFSYSNTEAHIAKQVIDDILKTLIDGAVLDSITDKKKAQKFLVEQIESQEIRLTVAENKLANFKQKNVGLMPSDGQGYYAKLQSAYDNREKTRSDIRVAQNKFNLLTKQLRGEAPAFASDSDIDKQIRKQTIELEELLLKFTEQYPDVIAKRQIIAQLTKKKEADLKRNLSNDDGNEASALSLNPVYQDTKIALSAAAVELKTLQSSLYEQNIKIKKFEALVDTIPEIEAQLVRLNRDYEVIKKQYEELLSRLESAKLSTSADKGGENVKFKVIDPPYVPFKPSSPQRGLLMLAVLGAGIGAGLGLMFLLYMLRPVFITTTELHNKLGLPVLGAVKIRWSFVQKQKLKLELTKFLIAAGCLLVIFGIAFMFKDSGSYYLQTVILGKGA